MRTERQKKWENKIDIGSLPGQSMWLKNKEKIWNLRKFDILDFGIPPLKNLFKKDVYILVLYICEKLWLVVIAEVKCKNASLTPSLSKGSGYQGKVGCVLIKFRKELYTVR